MKLKSIVLFMLLISNVLFATTLNQARSIVSQLMNDNGLSYSVNISINNAQSGGFASVRGFGNNVSIFLHANELSRNNTNTWAFVLGHELSHVILSHSGPNGPREERAADVRGARLAMRSGYDLNDYIFSIYRQLNHCTPSHGCWHERAKNLEDNFNVETGEHREHHEDHEVGLGPFPQTRLNVDVRVPCTHQTTCSHQMPCNHQMACVHRGPCGHQPIWNGRFWVRPHQFDQAHPFDTAHPFHTAHQFDFLHWFDVVRN